MGYWPSVSQDGWILAKLFFCMFMAETELRCIDSKKKNEVNIKPS